VEGGNQWVKAFASLYSTLVNLNLMEAVKSLIDGVLPPPVLTLREMV